VVIRSPTPQRPAKVSSRRETQLLNQSAIGFPTMGYPSMSHIHAREYLDSGDIVVVNCDHQCNVLVMNDSNYHSYRSGQRFEYHGGHYKMLPARISVPHADHWNTVIDLGGGRASIRYNIGYLKRAA
jgi:hypothetical protein